MEPDKYDRSPPKSTGGWTFGRVVLLIIGLIGLIGFGTCSICGIILGFGGGMSDIGIFLTFSVPGLVIAWLCFLLIRKMFRDARCKSDDGSN